MYRYNPYIVLDGNDSDFHIYDQVTFDLEDHLMDKQLNSMEVARRIAEFRKNTQVYYRNKSGQLVLAKPGSPEAGYKRCPTLGHQLVKV